MGNSYYLGIYGQFNIKSVSVCQDKKLEEPIAEWCNTLNSNLKV